MAKRIGGELVSADSRHVYQGLDIVTGKDPVEIEKSGIPIHLLDTVNARETWSSHEFAARARRAISDIIARGNVPIVVGGSWLYIKHLLYGFDIQVEPNAKLRDFLNTWEVEQLRELFNKLRVDFQSRTYLKSYLADSFFIINESDWSNPHRLIRKIEILTHCINLAPTDVLKQATKTKSGGLFSPATTMIGFHFETPEALAAAISRRVEKRVQAGAVDEAKKLLLQYGASAPGLQTIGYTQLIKYLQGEWGIDDALEEWTTREIQYAKRQYTFMKSDPNIVWHTTY